MNAAMLGMIMPARKPPTRWIRGLQAGSFAVLEIRCRGGHDAPLLPPSVRPHRRRRLVAGFADLRAAWRAGPGASARGAPGGRPPGRCRPARACRSRAGSTAAAPQASPSVKAAAPAPPPARKPASIASPAPTELSGETTGRLAVDRAVVVDEHRAVGAEACQHRAGAARRAAGSPPSTTSAMVASRTPGHLGELVAVGLDEASGRRRRPPRGPDRWCRPPRGSPSRRAHGRGPRRRVGGRSGRQAAAGDEPVGRLDRLLDRAEHGVELVGAELGARLVDLGRRPVGLDDGDVRPDRPGDRHRHDVDPGAAQERRPGARPRRRPR